MHTLRTRAKPLSADDRRRSIVNAVIPLLIEHGRAVTSRQMAEAAGVAEGTIFRVFPDKAAVIHEAIAVSLDPNPVRQAIETIPTSLPLDRQLEIAAFELMERSRRLAALIGVLGTMRRASLPDHKEVHERLAAANEVVIEALTRLFARHAGALNVTPRRAAIVFRGLVFVNVHPMITPADKLDAGDVVRVAISGLAGTRKE